MKIHSSGRIGYTLALIAAAVCAHASSPTISPTRTSGIAPLSVNFNAIAGRPWSQYSLEDYQWDFGDGVAFNGFLAAHVFDPTFNIGETQRTFTVTLTARNQSGVLQGQDTKTITVLNPAVAYSETDTFCFSNDAAFTGCPTSVPANRVQTSNMSVVQSRFANNRRLLLKRGGTFSGNLSPSNVAGVTLGAFGAGNRPILSATGINFGVNVMDVRFIDLDMQSGGAGVGCAFCFNTQMPDAQVPMDLLVRNVSITGYFEGFIYQTPYAGQVTGTRNFVIDGLKMTGVGDTHYGVGAFGGVLDNFAILNTSFTEINGICGPGCGGHTMRFCNGNKVLLNKVSVYNCPSTQLTVRSGTSQVLVSDSNFGPGLQNSSNVTGCVNTSSPVVPEVIFERNVYDNVISLDWSQNMVVRNNLFKGQHAISAGSFGTYKIYNNVQRYAPDVYSDFLTGDNIPGLEVINNIHSTKGGLPIYNGNSPGAVVSNNIHVNAAGLLWAGSNPANVDYFRLTNASVGVDGGLVKTARSFDLILRPAGSASDVGAFETTTSPQTPAITSQPVDQTVAVGQTATFSVTASGATPLFYQWQKNGVVIAGAGSPSYTTPPASQADQGSAFRAVVTNSVGSATSNSAFLNVSSDTTPPSVIITSPPNGSVVSGTVPLTASASDNIGVVGVQFSVDGFAVGPEDTSSPFTGNWNSAGAPAGTHTIGATARDAAGNTKTTTISVTIVFGPPSSNLALNKPASASSVESGLLVATNAVDGNANTRWGSAYSDPQWLQSDLLANYNVTGVVLNWEYAYAKSYSIQVSTNGTSWTIIYSTTSGDGGVDTLSFAPVLARYVRMLGTQRATPYGYSLWEFEVYGTSASPPPGAPILSTAEKIKFQAFKSVSYDAANDGGPITSCIISPPLPMDLTFNSTTCSISGTAGKIGAATHHTMTASNAGGSSSVSFDLAFVAKPPTHLTQTYLGIGPGGQPRLQAVATGTAISVAATIFNAAGAAVLTANAFMTLRPDGAVLYSAPLTGLSAGIYSYSVSATLPDGPESLSGQIIVP